MIHVGASRRGSEQITPSAIRRALVAPCLTRGPEQPVSRVGRRWPHLDAGARGLASPRLRRGPRRYFARLSRSGPRVKHGETRNEGSVDRPFTGGKMAGDSAKPHGPTRTVDVVSEAVKSVFRANAERVRQGGDRGCGLLHSILDCLLPELCKGCEFLSVETTLAHVK